MTVDILIGLALLTGFVSVMVVYHRHAAALERMEGVLYQMPVWWLRQRQYGRRQS